MICRPYKECQKTHISQGFSSTHPAVDFCYKYGTFLVAPENCVITRIVTPKTLDKKLDELEYGYGIRFYSLNNPNRTYSFWHCLPFFPVKFDDIVLQGQPIAQMGNSGLVKANGNPVPITERLKYPYPGTHLHFVMWENGEPVDCRNYIDWDMEIRRDVISDIILATRKILFNISEFLKGRR